jgi:hypothetical protein
MSARNGDKSRHNSQRKRKINKRLRNRELAKELTAKRSE